MLQLPSGADFGLRSYVFDAPDDSHTGEVRRFAAHLTKLLGFAEDRASRVAIIINEFGSNLSRHADEGRFVLQPTTANGVKTLQIFAIDSGPGIRNLDHAMTDGVTSGSTPGTGLGAIRRQADEFDIHSDSSGTIAFAAVHATSQEAIVDRPCFSTAVICSPIEGESVCGDSWCQIRNGDVTVMMVADGLGHGPNAHKASAAAVRAFKDMDPSLPLEVMIKRIHELLRSTRGAAVSIARLNPVTKQVDSIGVGNVRMVLSELPKDKTLISHSGTVGLQYRSVVTSATSWSGDGYLVMHSDGLQTRWTLASLGIPPGRHPALVAGKLFRDQNRATDDSTVLVGGFIA